MTHIILEECQKIGQTAEQMDQLIHNFHDAIGWDPLDQALLPSSYLSSGTWGQILHATTLVLDAGNIPDAKEKVQFWHDNLGDIHANDKPLIDDLPGFMSILRQQYEGVLIAICTSDDRRATDSCIKNWKLQDHIDVSLYISTHSNKEYEYFSSVEYVTFFRLLNCLFILFETYFQ